MNTCDVCLKNEPVGVACVPGVPMSVAYCKECLAANAHPYRILVGNTAIISSLKSGGNYLEDCADWWIEMVMDTLKYLDKTLEEFNLDVGREITELDGFI